MALCLSIGSLLASINIYSYLCYHLRLGALLLACKYQQMQSSIKWHLAPVHQCPHRGGSFYRRGTARKLPNSFCLAPSKTGAVPGEQAPCHHSRWGWVKGGIQETLSNHRVHVSEGRVPSQEHRNGSLSSAPGSSLKGSVVDFKTSVIVSKSDIVILFLTKLFQPGYSFAGGS